MGCEVFGASEEIPRKCQNSIPLLSGAYEGKDHFELTRAWNDKEVDLIDAHIKAYKVRHADHIKAIKDKIPGKFGHGDKQWTVLAKHLVS